MKSDTQPNRRRHPLTREELLAWELANSLNDVKGIPLYVSYARKYPEPFLRGVLAVALDIPIEKIRKSRGALFNYLVQKHGKEYIKNPGY